MKFNHWFKNDKKKLFEDVQNELHHEGTIKYRIKRVKFLLTPSYAFTAWKAQGKTFKNVILYLTEPPNGSVDPSYWYVALSRTKSISDILIMRPFIKNVLAKR